MSRGATAAVLAVLYGWCAYRLPPWIGWAFGWTAFSAGWVALVYATNTPRLLGKLDAPRLAAVALFPFLASARAAARVPARWGAEERTEVAPGLWVGAWPAAGPSELAHVDCTAELPRRARPVAYRCVPMLDAVPMRPAALEAAIDQVVTWRREGRPVLVHCAYGHGRSVTVAACALVRLGLADDLDAAEGRIRARRPRARMTDGQRAAARKTLENAEA